MEVSEKQFESLHKNGFVVIKGLYSNEEISDLRRLVYIVFCKVAGTDVALEKIEKPWNSHLFDEKLCNFRLKRPNSFGELYDILQGSYMFHKFVTKSEIGNLVAQLLGDSPENLSCSGLLFRLDAPEDKRNTLNWHQDISYFPQNFDGSNGMVVTTVLQDTPENMGALNICAGSHNEKAVDPEYTDGVNAEKTEQRSIAKSLVSKYPLKVCELHRGDTLIFNLNLFHSSGYNTSNRIRYSALCRYHRISADDYVPYRVYHKFNLSVADRILKAQDADCDFFRSFYLKG